MDRKEVINIVHEFGFCYDYDGASKCQSHGNDRYADRVDRCVLGGSSPDRSGSLAWHPLVALLLAVVMLAFAGSASAQTPSPVPAFVPTPPPISTEGNPNLCGGSLDPANCTPTNQFRTFTSGLAPLRSIVVVTGGGGKCLTGAGWQQPECSLIRSAMWYPVAAIAIVWGLRRSLQLLRAFGVR